MNDETDKISHSALNFLAKERVLLAILEAAENSGQVTVETVQKKIDDEKFAHLLSTGGESSGCRTLPPSEAAKKPRWFRPHDDQRVSAG